MRNVRMALWVMVIILSLANVALADTFGTQASYGTVTGSPSKAYDQSSYWTGTNFPTTGVSEDRPLNSTLCTLYAGDTFNFFSKGDYDDV
ncbi:MAG: hypothetical protein J7M40_05890 [Planctomycetes bacterium]|nr:hypothetical protein [Planctomycetota bacterium]